MKKRSPYKVAPVKSLDASPLVEDVEDQRVIVGIDVAKEKMVAAVVDEGDAVLKIVGWSHPIETAGFVELVRALAGSAADVAVAMEPSGVYGDALRWQLIEAGFEVHRVSPKKSYDASEIYDGVPSSHDGKSSAIVAWLHGQGKSEPWPVRTERERGLTALLRVLEVHSKQFRQNRNRLEGFVARHWPELTRYLDLDKATLLELLLAYGGPAAVAANLGQARELMLRVGGAALGREKVEAVLESAQHTVGMPQVAEEVAMVQAIAAEARRNQKSERAARGRVEELSAAEGSTKEMQAVVGKTTAAVIVAAAGDPLNYESPQAFQKSVGLNLKERSSGKKVGALRITKRGSGTARMFLYMASLRLIQSDETVRAWYTKKVARDGGRQKIKAVVAVSRKLTLALWHVARGEEFDSSKLFDRRRLGLSS